MKPSELSIRNLKRVCEMREKEIQRIGAALCRANEAYRALEEKAVASAREAAQAREMLTVIRDLASMGARL